MPIIYALGHHIMGFLAKYYLRLQIRNADIPREFERGAIIASNHVSFLDPPMVGIGTGQAIWYIARKTLFNHPFFDWLYKHWQAIPLDQNKPELSTMKKAIRLVKDDGEKLLIFPEGERSWDGELGEGAQGIGFILAKSKSPVIPARIFGAFESYPRGSAYPKRGMVTVIYGDPIDMETFLAESGLRGKALYAAATERVMDGIRELDLYTS